MRVGVIGINHKLANLELRERLAQACQRCFAIGGAAADTHTFVLLSTCNRTEIYFSSSELSTTHTYLLSLLRHEIEEEFDQKIYSYFGQDCFHHLCRVIAGLDSAIVAETEIQGQVKAAYEKAAACIELPHDLHYLFQKGLAIGKNVRSSLILGRGMPDLEHAVFNAGQNVLTASSRILFVGASEVNYKILKFFKAKKMQQITLCNRSKDKALSVAKELQIKVMPWSQLKQWHLYDWIIFSTKAPSYLVTTQEAMVNSTTRKLVIDLSVPRNVDPKMGLVPNMTLLNIDQINLILQERKQRMTAALEQAEWQISHKTQQYTSLYKNKANKLMSLNK